jgi:hypothetical protein
MGDASNGASTFDVARKMKLAKDLAHDGAQPATRLCPLPSVGDRDAHRRDRHTGNLQD